MSWRRHILVVANVTATSDELLSVLSQRAETEPTAFTLVCPATRRFTGEGTAEAAANCEDAAVRMRELGLVVTDGRVGVADPFEAAVQVYDPREYDEIIVSTLPSASSRWLALDAPRRIQRYTGAPVTHVAGTVSKTFA